MIDKKLIEIKFLSKKFVISLSIPCPLLGTAMVSGICKVEFFPMGWSVIHPCQNPYRDSRGFGKIPKSHQP